MESLKNSHQYVFGQSNKTIIAYKLNNLFGFRKGRRIHLNIIGSYLFEYGIRIGVLFCCFLDRLFLLVIWIWCCNNRGTFKDHKNSNHIFFVVEISSKKGKHKCGHSDLNVFKLNWIVITKKNQNPGDPPDNQHNQFISISLKRNRNCLCWLAEDSKWPQRFW